jgi:hypothetical protein
MLLDAIDNTVHACWKARWSIEKCVYGLLCGERASCGLRCWDACAAEVAFVIIVQRCWAYFT